MNDDDKTLLYDWAKADQRKVDRLCAIIGITAAIVSAGVVAALHFLRK